MPSAPCAASVTCSCRPRTDKAQARVQIARRPTGNACKLETSEPRSHEAGQAGPAASNQRQNARPCFARGPVAVLRNRRFGGRSRDSRLGLFFSLSVVAFFGAPVRIIDVGQPAEMYQSAQLLGDNPLTARRKSPLCSASHLPPIEYSKFVFPVMLHECSPKESRFGTRRQRSATLPGSSNLLLLPSRRPERLPALPASDH